MALSAPTAGGAGGKTSLPNASSAAMVKQRIGLHHISTAATLAVERRCSMIPYSGAGMRISSRQLGGVMGGIYNVGVPYVPKNNERRRHAGRQ